MGDRAPDSARSYVSAKHDRILTALQQDGYAYVVGTVAEAVQLCDTLGLDPRHVIVHGRLTVEERPAGGQ